MIVDFRDIDRDVLRADVCIIGAGAAGITIARELINTGRDVIVLESGGYEIEDDTQALCRGENIGLPYYDLETARLRFLGGSTNHWAGECAPLDMLDFEKRSWVPYSGWDLTRSELLPFYVRAQPILGLGSIELNEESAWEALGIEGPDLDKARLVTRFFQQSRPPTRFGEAYRDELAAAANVIVYLHANVTNIRLSDDGRHVKHLDVASIDGRKGKVEAKYIVLACGGLENPRLLLNSKDVRQAGVGNDYDNVGRYFMEHAEIECAELFEESNNDLAWKFAWFSDLAVKATFCPSDALQKSEEVLNFSGLLFPIYETNAALASAKEIASSAKRLELPDDLDEKVLDVLSDLDGLAATTYARYWVGSINKYSHVNRLPLQIRSEQAPNPDSRVVLATERDALGLHRINLDWRLTDLDLRTTRIMVRTIASELGRLRVARLRQSDWLDNGWDGSGVSGGPHHMGTTRMCEDPKRGVVDKNCRVHGVGNLFVAGSSVFPTGGRVNPTFTIVALSLRLSDHLKRQLA